MTDTSRIAGTRVQKVVVVDGSSDILERLEAVLDAGCYDMAFVESDNDAYAQIRSVCPNLVILCARIDEVDGLQLLTMLKLDPKTRSVPVLTFPIAGQDVDAVSAEPAEDEEEELMRRPAHQGLRMN